MSLIRSRAWSDGTTTIDFASYAIAVDTYRGYEREVLAFLDWVVSRGMRIDSVAGLDGPLSEYMHRIARPRGKGACARVVCGVVHFFPEAKGRVPRSMLTLRGVNRFFPPVQHVPVSWEVTVLISFYQCARWGLRYGVASLLSHHCLLRVSECLGLVREDVVELRDIRLSRLNTNMVLRLAKTKAGLVQSVVVSDVAVQSLVRLLLRDTAAGERIFPFSPTKFRTTIREALVVWHIDIHVTPHCFRDGGATRHWLMYRDRVALKAHGRWVDDRSVARYVQPAEMMLLQQRVPAHFWSFAFVLALDIPAWLTLIL